MSKIGCRKSKGLSENGCDQNQDIDKTDEGRKETV